MVSEFVLEFDIILSSFCLPHSLLLILNFRSNGITSNKSYFIILFTFLIIILPIYLTYYLAKQIFFILLILSKIIFSHLYAFSLEWKQGAWALAYFHFLKWRN